MTIYGSVDHMVSGVNAPLSNNTFVAAYNFLLSMSSSLGIQRIAYNVGSGGLGMSYAGEGAAAGDNAWAVFKFANAQIPFYIIIQWSSQSSIGYPSYAAGTPAINHLNIPRGLYGGAVSFSQDDYRGRGFGFVYQFAQLLNGGNPWNGTTLDNGADTKGDPVWVSGATEMVVFPNVNNPRISGYPSIPYHTSTNYMRSLYFSVGASITVTTDGANRPLYVYNYNPTFFNIVADEENVLFWGGTSTGSNVHYYGRMSTHTQSFAQPKFDLPYMYFSSYAVTTDPAVKYWSPLSSPASNLGDYYGAIARSSSVTWGGGGDPPSYTIIQGGDDSLEGGALFHSSSLGVCRLYFDTTCRHKLRWFYLNYNFVPPRYDTYPLNVWAANNQYFTGNYYGFSFLGTTSPFLRMIGRAANGDVDSAYRTCVVGNTGGTYTYAGNTLVTQNLAFPWGGGVVPLDTSYGRAGVQF